MAKIFPSPEAIETFGLFGSTLLQLAAQKTSLSHLGAIPVSKATILEYSRQIFEKLDVTNWTEAVAVAQERKFLTESKIAPANTKPVFSPKEVRFLQLHSDGLKPEQIIKELEITLFESDTLAFGICHKAQMFPLKEVVKYAQRHMIVTRPTGKGSLDLL